MADTVVTLPNGEIFSFPSSFDGTAYLTALKKLAQAFVDAYDQTAQAAEDTQAILNAQGDRATSASSITVGLGSKSLITQTGKNFPVGLRIRVIENGNSGRFIAGEITAYDSVTGGLTLNADNFGGSGTATDWIIFNDTGITRVADDGNPQLGGPLDLNGKIIKDDSGGALTIGEADTAMALLAAALTITATSLTIAGTTTINSLKLGGQMDGNAKSVINTFGKSEADIAPANGDTVTLNRALGENRKVTCPASGLITIAASGFPSGNVTRYCIKLVNGGNVTITWPTGVVAPSDLKTSGTDHLVLQRDKDGGYNLFKARATE